ncbi:hypothetical protein BHE74_00012286 [Ensete ventricosum]|nr:hypothetical protein BHE74_00012286 [Ensete ventricosum]
MVCRLLRFFKDVIPVVWFLLMFTFVASVLRVFDEGFLRSEESVCATMTTTMVVASRRGDLNLNHAPLPDYEEQVKEGLKQAMVEHNILFKHQVLPLFRLVDFRGYTNLFLEL